MNLDIQDIVTIVTSVVTIFSVIARFTKATWDDNFVGKMIRLLSLAPKRPPSA